MEAFLRKLAELTPAQWNYVVAQMLAYDARAIKDTEGAETTAQRAAAALDAHTGLDQARSKAVGTVRRFIDRASNRTPSAMSSEALGAIANVAEAAVSRATLAVFSRTEIQPLDFAILYGTFSWVIQPWTLGEAPVPVSAAIVPPRSATQSTKGPKGPNAGQLVPAEPRIRSAGKYGPNSTQVENFIQAVRNLRPIVWSRILFNFVTPLAEEEPANEAITNARQAVAKRPEASQQAQSDTCEAVRASIRIDDGSIASAILPAMSRSAEEVASSAALALVLSDVLELDDALFLYRPFFGAIPLQAIDADKALLARFEELLRSRRRKEPRVAPTDLPNVAYTRHAEARMAQRRISDEEVKAAIGAHHIRYAGRDGTTVYVGRPGGRRIKVVVRHDAKELLVITVAD